MFFSWLAVGTESPSWDTGREKLLGNETSLVHIEFNYLIVNLSHYCLVHRNQR